MVQLVKPSCNVGDPGSIPGLGRYTGEGIGYPLQYSALENSMDYSPWVHKESDMTQRPSLSLHVSLVKNSPANAGDLRDTVSIPELRRFPWRRAWQPTPIFVPGESFWQGSLLGYRPCIHRVRHDWSNLPHSTHILLVIPLYSSVFSWS